jgi:hypothetical protein
MDAGYSTIRKLGSPTRKPGKRIASERRRVLLDLPCFFLLFAGGRLPLRAQPSGATASADTQPSFADAVNVAAFFLTKSCTLSGPCPVSVRTSSDSTFGSAVPDRKRCAVRRKQLLSWER